MDITVLQAQEAALQNSIVTDETTLANDQEELAKVQAELGVAQLANSLEALTSDQVMAVNEILVADGSTLVLTLPAPELPPAEA